MGTIIVFEGPDKVGKETQSKMLVAHLNSIGKKAVRYEIPYDDSLTHKVIYWMLKTGRASSSPGLFQWFQYLNKRLFQSRVLKRALKENDYVVLDRWRLSALIYGRVTGVSKVDCEDQYASLTEPDATIVLHGKALSDKKDDVYEADDYIQRRVKALYSEWTTDNHANGARLIHASGTRGEVHINVVNALIDVGVL